MAGTALDCQLAPARTAFALATQTDDADIRRLLRENPMRGQISLTLEREPNYFADAHLPGAEKQTVVARDGSRVVCVGSCVVRKRFVNGKPHRVGYLGGLRLDARAAGRFDILRRGYEFFRELQADRPADFYFTSIASDNAPARKFLERGLPRMPVYEFIGEFVTLFLPVGRRAVVPAARAERAPDFAEISSGLNEYGRQYQFAEWWQAEELAGLSVLGLPQGRYRCVREEGRITATAAIWDQRTFKQTVIRGYAPWLMMARPVANVAARLLGTTHLPAVGSALSHVFVSHVAVEPAKAGALLTLIAALRTSVQGLPVEFLTLGFAAKDPRLSQLRNQFRCREYRSRIYVVRWPGIGGSVRDLDDRCLGPEVALL